MEIEEKIIALEERKEMAMFQRKITTELCTVIEYDQEIGAIERKIELLKLELKQQKTSNNQINKTK